MTDNIPEVTLVAALDAFRGTVTEFLEQSAGEPVDADIRSQFMATATDANKFELDPESTVMHRAVFLRGRTTARNFVFALSQIAIGHLPEAVRRQLQETSDPIGRVLFDNGIDVGRKTILGPIDSSDVAEHPRTQISKAVLARRYLIVVGERPTFDVREWFLPSTLDALAATGDAHPNRRSPA